uniref:NADH dehydrogenase subunit 2 n=1 Tax=Lithodesmium undulatum TaxID=59812 RepID=A0A7T6UZM4_LITUN|nr:NADH dehydrogenase subunit 2 [Lithodesmium undulatum]QQJ94638.1 NADH dehydrogenase subunit 2 [Lithodesmium undulatum]
MTLNLLTFKEISILPELFLGISIIYLLMHGIFLTVNKKYPLIKNSFIYLSVLILFMTCFLLTNDSLNYLELSNFNFSIINDYLSFSSKILVSIISICCLFIINSYLKEQKINQFEYILLILFAILGIFLLCSSDDLLTAYLAIELQSLAFYVLAAFKKNSTFSVESGLKYFILGAFSSSFFLFGSSLIYGISGSISFESFKDLYFTSYPGNSLKLLTLKEYYYNQDQLLIFYAIIQKLVSYDTNFLNEQDFHFLYNECSSSLITNNQELSIYRDLLHSIDNVFSNYIFWDFLNVGCLTKKDVAFLGFVYMFIECYETEFEKIFKLGDTLNNLELLNCDTFGVTWNVSNFHNKLLMLSKLDSYQDFNYLNLFFDTTLLQCGLIFILVSLFFKLALAPFHIWSPDVYEGSPSSSTFFFAVIPKIGIFVLLLRIFYYSFYNFLDNFRYLLVLIAILSVVVGSFVGLEQRKLKSLLAYSSISHMGYSLLAFSTGTFEGLQMLYCYLLIYMLSGLCIWSIFFLTRLKNKYNQKQNKDLADLLLLRKSNSVLALAFAVVLLSIAGFPPMIGFIVKFGVFLSAIESSLYFVALISILCSVISAFYYLRIIKIMYFEKNLTGKLYYPITSQKSIIVVINLFLFFLLFMNPTLIYLFSYKLSLLMMY